MTPKPLPPLAEVFDDVFYRGIESERNREGSVRATSRAKAVALAAPYDAELARLRAENLELRERLARFEALAEEAAGCRKLFAQTGKETADLRAVAWRLAEEAAP